MHWHHPLRLNPSHESRVAHCSCASPPPPSPGATFTVTFTDVVVPVPLPPPDKVTGRADVRQNSGWGNARTIFTVVLHLECLHLARGTMPCSTSVARCHYLDGRQVLHDASFIATAQWSPCGHDAINAFICMDEVLLYTGTSTYYSTLISYRTLGTTQC